MSNNRPKLSDIARQNNAAKVSKSATTMVPPPPVQPEPTSDATQETSTPGSLKEVIDQDEADFADGKGTTFTAEEPLTKLPASESSSTAKPGRKRNSQLSLDDILNAKAPDEEGFAKMARISDKHHALLRKIAYEQRKPMNTIMYNLLEALDQAYQRDQPNSQNHA